MSIYYNDDRVTLHHGDALDVLRSLPDCSVDSVVTDPPYELGFMGKAWDGQGIAYSVDLWAECLRVLKPGGHLLSFGGTRTWHRMVCAIEDAGFEVRDSIAWLYGSGFPKSLDVSKAIDKAAGAEREVVGTRVAQDIRGGRLNATVKNESYEINITAPATPDATRWQGWGTALKPAHEPVCVARKPLIGTVAANVLEHGTGALNIDGTRIGYSNETDSRIGTDALANGFSQGDVNFGINPKGKNVLMYKANGRWPANVILDDYTADLVDQQSGTLKSGKVKPYEIKEGDITVNFKQGLEGKMKTWTGEANEGGASRFFYCAKAPKRERVKVDGIAHPTVKPLTLMRWLVRLVTPPGGTVLEPFAGSGTTIEAAIQEGFNVIGIERETDYLPLIVARIERNNEQQMVLDA